MIFFVSVVDHLQSLFMVSIIVFFFCFLDFKIIMYVSIFHLKRMCEGKIGPNMFLFIYIFLPYFSLFMLLSLHPGAYSTSLVSPFNIIHVGKAMVKILWARGNATVERRT